jgi:hypothetical protein
MSKVRDISNLSNVIRTDASGNVSFVSGSTTLATINTSGQLSGSSPVLSSSYALNATSASYAVSASNATNAVTASFANAFTVANTLTAQTLVVQTITSSVDFVTGSTRFGSLSSNTHIITGSMFVTGAFYVTTGSVGIGTTSPSKLLHLYNTAATDIMLVESTQVFSTIAFKSSTNSSTVTLGIDGAGNAAFENKLTTGAMAFVTNGSERMRINATGSVGIGASNITGKFMIYQGTAGNVFQSIVSNQGGSTQVGINLNPSMNESDAATYQAQSSIYATDYSYSANIIFATKDPGAYANSLTERMRIRYNGNVGIGGITSDQRLAIYGGSNAGTVGVMLDGGGTPTLQLYSLTNEAGIGTNSYTSKPLTFKVGMTYDVTNSGTVAMSITSGGLVGINTTASGNGQLNVYNATGTFCINVVDAANTGNLQSFKNSSLAQVGSITENGSSTSYNTTSDYRLKEDLKDFNGLEKISAIKVYDFKWKSNEERTNGVLAHELAEVLPYAVHGEKDGLDRDGNPSYQGVDYSKIVPSLVKAIQEQQAQINELKAQING